jgi:hypothetical protein
VDEPHPLDTVRLKLRRAKKHLEVLDDSMLMYLNSQFYERFAEQYAKNRIAIKVRNIEPTPLWPVLIGDCVYNLRSTLDYLAWELARPAFAPDDPPLTIQFPIFDRRWKYRSERGFRGAARMMQCFPRGARTIVESLQPYHRRKYPATWYLGVLQELSNIDKHRTLHTTAVSLADSTWTLSGDPGAIRRIRTYNGPFVENAVMARVYLARNPKHEMHVDAKVVPDVVFDESGPAHPAKGELVRRTLANTSNFIELEVLPRFERFFS